jgi:outer membrane lipoprotein
LPPSGEVLGTTRLTIGDVEQQVPQLAVKHITVWEWDRMRAGTWPYSGYAYATYPFAWGYRPNYGHR